MSIYKKEAAMEEMRQEAVQRMNLLHLSSKIIQKFAQNEAVYLSQQFGQQVFLQPNDDEIKTQVKQFEQEFECLVYHVLLTDNPLIGECWSLLFVSPASSDWKSEREYIESSGLVYAYVKSDMEDGISEIMVTPQDGGLIRLG